MAGEAVDASPLRVGTRTAAPPRPGAPVQDAGTRERLLAGTEPNVLTAFAAQSVSRLRAAPGRRSAGELPSALRSSRVRSGIRESTQELVNALVNS